MARCYPTWAWRTEDDFSGAWLSAMFLLSGRIFLRLFPEQTQLHAYLKP
jgi:hypothetical protein